MNQIEEKLFKKIEDLLSQKLAGFLSLISIKQLTGGASRVMHKIEAQTTEGSISLVLRTSSVLENEGFQEQLTLNKEKKVIEAVYNSGIPTPEVLFGLDKDDDLGEGYIMRFLSGETLGGRIAKSKNFAAAREKLSEQLGRSLGQIHMIDTSEFEDYVTKTTPLKALEGTYAIYQRLQQNVPMIEYATTWLRHHIPNSNHYVLTHGDFRNGNFLVDPSEGLIGILDWELASLADPMKDLAWACLQPWRYGVGHLEFGGISTQSDFINAYERASQIKFDEARFTWWQVYSCLWWSIACMAMGLSYRLKKGQSGDRIAIGRRHTEGLIDLVNLIIPGAPPESMQHNKTPIGDVANLEELISSSLEDLTKGVIPVLSGKSLFTARVVTSNLAIALRELQIGVKFDQLELQSINTLLTESFEDIQQARERLALWIKNGESLLTNAYLQKYLRESIIRRIEIDQPKYSGLQLALSN